MPPLRVFHPCLPAYDNLGDIVANQSLTALFGRRGVAIERTVDDIAARWKGTGGFLDERLDEINANYDMMLIGPGGFLGPKMIDNIFRDFSSWDALRIPLCLAGIGIVASVRRPVWYTAAGEDTHVVRALRRADAIAVRELNSWLLGSRVRPAGAAPPLLTGCPSLWTVRLPSPPAKTHDLALNLSFVHEVCLNYIPQLLDVARACATQNQSVLWVCHSQADADQARGVVRQLGLGFDVVQPRDAAEAGAAYAACSRALVTRFHAGMFCLANTVPFGFIGYDMKCWHLLTMIADEPYRYILPIDRLGGMDIGNEVAGLLQRLDGNAGNIRAAQSLLLDHFETQTALFVDAVLGAVGQS